MNLSHDQFVNIEVGAAAGEYVAQNETNTILVETVAAIDLVIPQLPKNRVVTIRTGTLATDISVKGFDGITEIGTITTAGAHCEVLFLEDSYIFRTFPAATLTVI